MTTITIDNQPIECRDGMPVLQAALDAGIDVPYYCYHPGLSIVASCRLCLMEMKMPHLKTQEMVWAPKLIPSCQTPVRDGMEVRFDSEAVRKNQRSCMEFFLLNHPLDCPVCDKAGECRLQDFSYGFGSAESRMVDQKLVNPKKNLGPHTLLYQDRCVMCTRCVRFTAEVSGTHELCVVNRGSRSEIDVFPGLPLDNPLQGNVVDLCPVGCLLDKDFLFQRRVWELRGTPSICPGCATGCSIRVDHADERVYRLTPRHNPEVNEWWMCDEGRFGFSYVHDARRITRPIVRRGLESSRPRWEDLPGLLCYRIREHVREHGGASLGAMISPFMACEEAWLLVRFLREVAPDGLLALGPIPRAGEDQRFPISAEGDAVRFTIRSEKCPNRRGIDMVLDAAGGATCTNEDFVKHCTDGDISAAWIVGGYPTDWVGKDLVKAAEKLDLLVVQDLFPSDLTAGATIVVPSAAWTERAGCFVNADGLIQPFERAVAGPERVWPDGRWLFLLAGFEGLYSGERVRELMAATMPEFGGLCDAAAELAPAM